MIVLNQFAVTRGSINFPPGYVSKILLIIKIPSAFHNLEDFLFPNS